MKKKCKNCKIEYPSEILSPLMTSDDSSGSVCGICALVLSNQALGINRKKFQGETAEDFRQEAINFRKKSKLSYKQTNKS